MNSSEIPCDSSDHTAENYYSYLKQAFLLIGINKFSFKSKDRIRNEKVYVVDTALATDKEGTIASENLGWRLEHILCVELQRRCKPLFQDFFYFNNASSHYPELDREGHWLRTLEHIREKYADGGYLKLWIPESDNARKLEDLRELIRRPALLREIFDREFSQS